MIMNTNTVGEKRTYKTADLALATATSLFYPLRNIAKQNPKKAYFLFEWSSSLEEFISSYWHGEVKVEPQAYFNQLKVIKARLYSQD